MSMATPRATLRDCEQALGGIARTVRHRGLGGTARIAYNMSLWNALRLARRGHATVPIHEFQMTLQLSDPGLSRQLFVYRDRERALGRILRGLIRKGMRVLDVGGNLGYYPLMEAELVGSLGRVFVMEPLQDNIEILRQNIRLNGHEDHVECYQLAADETAGTASFFVSDASNLGTLFPETRDETEQRHLTGGSVEVETIDLSSFIEPLRPLALIRMDPEGAEVGILKGLIPSIRKGRFEGRIVTEVHAAQYDPDTNDIRAVLAELFALGYYAEIVTSVEESSSPLKRRGYRADELVWESNRVVRGIYRGIADDDVADAMVEIGAVRDLVLAKREQ